MVLLYSSSCGMFGFLKNCQTVFLSGHTILHPYLQCMNDPVSPPPCLHLVVSLIFLHSHSSSWFHICISLAANDVEHCFMCLFAICTSCLVKSLHVFCPFSNWILWFFFCWVECSLHILDSSPLLAMWWTNIFSHCVACLFSLLESFSEKNFSVDEAQINISLWIMLLVVS